MHPLRQHVAHLRRLVRRLIVAYGLACTLIGLLGALLFLGSADYLLRFQDRGVRIIATLALVGVVVWVIYRFFWPAMSQRLTDVALARRVEARFPALVDRLSSAIHFLDQPEDEPTAGSAEMRRAVIAQTTAEVEQLDWAAAVDARPTLRACTIALAVILVATVIGLLQPHTTWVGFKRLTMPWRDVVWPREHSLAFKQQVTRVAFGQDFEVELVDLNGQPPADARIVYRYTVDGAVGEETQEKFTSLGDALVARKENVVRPFEYRAIGGDDDTMQWIAVDVVEPAAVESISITLHPPDYTGWPDVPSKRRIQALRGTLVALSGKSNKPIVAATVRQENGPDVPLRIADDGSGFALEIDERSDSSWIVEKSGKYWIELRDRDGLVGGNDDRWDTQAIADELPQIGLDRPIGTLFVTPSAVVPLKLTARDDLAIRQVLLHYLRSDKTDEGEKTVELYVGPVKVERVTAADYLATVSGGESKVIEYEWDLGPLALSPGLQLTMTASASDYRPQTSMSQAVRIVVLTPDEFEERLASRQNGILTEIARILKMQQEARTSAQALLTQAERVGEFRKQDADGAHTVELSQRQIRRSLASPAEGVLAQATALLDELVANRIDSPQTIRRVEQIEAEIRRLNNEELATIEQELVAVVKNSQIALQQAESKETIDRLAQSLRAAVAAQDGVIASLEKLLDQLNEWNSYRAIAADIAEIQRAQRELAQQTETMQPATLGRDTKDLTTQQQADLEKNAALQSELARRFDKLAQRMEEMGVALRDVAPLAAESLAAALETARRESVGSQMRDSARFVEANQLGQALQRQRRIDTILEELLDILSNRRAQELARLVKKLREAEAKLSELRGRQKGLRKKIKEAHDRLEAAKGNQEQQAEARRELERLTREQQKLKQETERLANQLERLEAARASQQLTSAGSKMNDGSQAGERGESGKAADLASEAKKSLDEAQRQLAEERRQAEQDLANEQLATIRQTIAGLASRQESLHGETKRLHEFRDAQGNLRPDQQFSLADLARNQAHLHTEADAAAEKITAAQVFQLALRSAAEQIRSAAELLAKGDTGDATQRAEAQALARLRQLLAALAEEQAAAADNQQQNQGENPPNDQPQNNQPQPIIHALTELKLLKVMQEDVNRRTIELETALAGKAATETEKRELALLAQEQGRIAELVAKMTAASASATRQANPEDDPDSLPDIRGEDPSSKGVDK